MDVRFRIFVLVVLTTARWPQDGLSLKFGMIFNVGKNKADLMISEDANIDMIPASETDTKNPSQTHKPPRRTTKPTTTTTTTTEKPTPYPWQEIDETRRNGARFNWGNSPMRMGNLPIPNYLPELKENQPVILTTTVVSEVTTKTEIIYPSCLVILHPQIGCVHKSTESTPPTDSEPKKPVGTLPNMSTKLMDFREDIKPTETHNFFSTSISIPMANEDNLESSIFEISYNDEEFPILRRSLLPLAMSYEQPMFYASVPELELNYPKAVIDETPEFQLKSSNSVIDETPATKYHVESLTVTKVEKFMDYGTTVSILSDGCPSPVNELPLCRPIAYPPNVAFQREKEFQHSAVEQSIRKVYEMVNETLFEDRIHRPELIKKYDVSSENDADGYEVVEYTTSQSISISEHDDESRDVEFVSDGKVSLK